MQVGWVKIRHFRRKMCYNSFTNGCSVGFRYAKNPLAAGADPTEELTTFHRPLIVGEGDTSPNAPLPSAAAAASIRFVVVLGGLTPHWLKMTPTLVTENF